MDISVYLFIYLFIYFFFFVIMVIIIMQVSFTVFGHNVVSRIQGYLLVKIAL